ncbi:MULTISPECIES: HD domain-containing protein [unclassified Aureimonas]|uniref:HD domain-containing protein n=1 Tax=unclassified Aureimonas TaxID=2615206 RepID=UPI000B287E72|nr:MULTISPECIES: HD domain-containing protein [unclassified Aureimonas]
MLTRADEIAAEAHAGQVDKGGAPYIDHPRRVAAAVEDAPAKIVALLHDVVEDCSAWTLDRLRAEGFGEDIIEAVDAMTKRRGEDYFSAILRARANTIARQVKLADLADNSDRTRLTHVSEADERRLDKYARATLMLRNA